MSYNKQTKYTIFMDSDKILITQEKVYNTGTLDFKQEFCLIKYS